MDHSSSSETYDPSTIRLSSIPVSMFTQTLPSMAPSHDSIRSPSHHHKHPARKQQIRPSSRHSRFTYSTSFLVTLTIFLTCCCSIATATIESVPQIIDDRQVSSQEHRSTLSQLANSGTIAVDQEPAPEPQKFEEIRRRNTKTTSTTSTTSSVAHSSTVASSQSTATPVALPTAYDTGIGNNFSTETCPQFIKGFLQSSTFQSCLPFSMLLDTSVSFFRAEQSLVRITHVLDTSCGVDSKDCTSYLTSLALNMTSSSVCGPDLTANIPVVQQVQTGLLAYSTLYTASCLKDNSTNSYCFADAITNSSSPTDSYVYYLPLNQSLVGGSQPTCNSCLQATMNVFQTAAANKSNTVADSYESSAKLINGLCGPGFVNATIPILSATNVAARIGGFSGLASLIVGLAMAVLVL